MTRTQELEVLAAQEALTEARMHLDNAMYRMGDITDEEIAKLREVYNAICEQIDKL